jgi:hypothetical protein
MVNYRLINKTYIENFKENFKEHLGTDGGAVVETTTEESSSNPIMAAIPGILNCLSCLFACYLAWKCKEGFSFGYACLAWCCSICFISAYYMNMLTCAAPAAAAGMAMAPGMTQGVIPMGIPMAAPMTTAPGMAAVVGAAAGAAPVVATGAVVGNQVGGGLAVLAALL